MPDPSLNIFIQLPLACSYNNLSHITFTSSCRMFKSSPPKSNHGLTPISKLLPSGCDPCMALCACTNRLVGSVSDEYYQARSARALYGCAAYRVGACSCIKGEQPLFKHSASLDAQLCSSLKRHREDIMLAIRPVFAFLLLGCFALTNSQAANPNFQMQAMRLRLI